MMTLQKKIRIKGLLAIFGIKNLATMDTKTLLFKLELCLGPRAYIKVLIGGGWA